MKVLIIGGGGREHALADALDRSPLLTRLYAAPGNPGIEAMAECIPLAIDDMDGVVDFALRQAIDLVVVGPEAPLVAGLADRLNEAGVRVFGPSMAAAELEGSKAFAREFCARHNIPQPHFACFDDAATAAAYLCQRYPEGGVVIKADGLAAGKGVIVADTLNEALDTVAMMLDGGVFGAAGARVVIEDRLQGREASLFAMAHGEEAVFIGTAQDYKRALDGDKGANTGGMGAISPAPIFEGEIGGDMLEVAWEGIILPTIRGMAAEGRPYRGFLYAGLMLTPEGPQVIEYNCRFGDPEAEAILPRLRVDLLTAMSAATDGGLGLNTMRFADNVAVTVVMANGGYPGPIRGAHEKGGVMTGLDDNDESSIVFHSGTSRADDGAICAAGGRVLAVTGMGVDAKAARQAAYDRVGRISWPGAFYRKDIGEGY